MNVKGYNLPVIIVVFLVALGGLMLVNWTHNELVVKKPLAQQIAEIEGVKTHSIVEDTEGLLLEVELTKVENLEETYMSLKEILNSYTNDDLAQIKIIDNPNEELTILWDEIQYYAYQSLAMGDFVTLKEKLETFKKDTFNYNVSISDSYLFIQLQSNDHNLYRVLPRD